LNRNNVKEMVMSTWVGIKVMAELVTVLGGLIFIAGVALRGRARDRAISFGAALVGISGLILLLECMFGLLDPRRYPSAILLLVFGTGVTAGVAHNHRKPDQAK
jgi:peptidoglycan/LPS O-acetylase OafA/YrhL